METRRFRLFPVLRLTPHLLLKTALEDNRIDQGPGNSHHLFLSRAYLQYENESFKIEAGRLNYYLMDGDLLDKKMDGFRIRYGHDDEGPGRSVFFYGRTAENRSKARKVLVLEIREPWANGLFTAPMPISEPSTAIRNPYRFFPISICPPGNRESALTASR